SGIISGGAGAGTGVGVGGVGGTGQITPLITSQYMTSSTWNNDIDYSQDRVSLANRLKTTGKLFDLMSAKSDIDHPMCQECADMLIEGLSKQLRDTSRERDCYIDFLRTINSSVVNDDKLE